MLLEWLQDPHLFWLSLGGVLLAAELLGASGYLLWSGIAAALVGIITWLVPLPWAWQGVSFAILTMLAAYFWWHWLKRRPARADGNSELNQRGRQMIGLKVTLLEPVVNGFSRVNIGDSTWRVSAKEELPQGQRVQVIDVEGNTLMVSRCD